MKSQFDKITFGGKEGGGMFLKTPFLLRFLANLANFVPPILILPCDNRFQIEILFTTSQSQRRWRLNQCPGLYVKITKLLRRALIFSSQLCQTKKSALVMSQGDHFEINKSQI